MRVGDLWQSSVDNILSFTGGMELLKEFFGVHDNQKKWLERQEYYLRKRLKPKPTSVNRQTDALAVSSQQTHRQPNQFEMKSVQQQCMMTTARAVHVDTATEQMTSTQLTERAVVTPKRKEPQSKTGRAPDVLKTKGPEHRLRLAMPSVLAMAVSGFRTLLKVSNYSICRHIQYVQYLSCMFFLTFIHA